MVGNGNDSYTGETVFGWGKGEVTEASRVEAARAMTEAVVVTAVEDNVII